MRYSQISLVIAVLEELVRQGRLERPPCKVTVQALNLNAVIAGVNLMLDTLNVNEPS